MSLIVILGPTAVGKTQLAVQLAKQLNGEVISADSRQVYRNMDLGTGKDLEEYKVDDTLIQHHLIDIKEAGETYHVFDFQRDFYAAYEAIIEKGKTAILCGGTGLYLEAALAKEKMQEVPKNVELREELAEFSQEELGTRLKKIAGALHNKTDLVDWERTVRAIEIEEFKAAHAELERSPVAQAVVIGVRMEREKLRNRIAERLESRLQEGMVEEVKSLISQGVSHEQLNYYGLEYRFLSKYIQGEIKYEEMSENLVQAIRRFAKKQMTWYRRMEKKGQYIHWIDAEDPMNVKLQKAMKISNKK